MAEIDLAANPVIAFDVTALYQYLATLSDEKPCCKLTGTKFLSTTRQADGCFLSKLRSAGQGEWQIRSRYIVDASGWHMAVLSSLSLGQAPARTGVGYEIEYPIGNMDPDTAIIFFGADARAGYGWGLPAPGGMFRLGIGVLQPDTADNPRDRMNDLLSSDRLARYGIEMPTPDHVNAGIIPSVPYDKRLVYGGVIRVGDSANMATPTLGEGIRLCIESGRHLGACLTRVLETGAAHHLKTYERMANRKYARNYRFGFLTNTRAAGYDEHDWGPYRQAHRAAGQRSVGAGLQERVHPGHDGPNGRQNPDPENLAASGLSVAAHMDIAPGAGQRYLLLTFFEPRAVSGAVFVDALVARNAPDIFRARLVIFGNRAAAGKTLVIIAFGKAVTH